MRNERKCENHIVTTLLLPVSLGRPKFQNYRILFFLKKKKLRILQKRSCIYPLHTNMPSLKTNLRNWLLPMIFFFFHIS